MGIYGTKYSRMDQIKLLKRAFKKCYLAHSSVTEKMQILKKHILIKNILGIFLP